MDKLRMESPDMTAQNIDRIAALFPNCVTEASDGHGGIKRAINFELLKQMLSPDVVDGDERYEFTWVGKKAAIVEANKPIRKTLRPCKEESKDWDTTENLYIEGDNLEVLKLLQESYLGKVKMIYIDPPYNTGNDFIYADDFMRSQKEENEQMGMYDEDGDRLFKNTDTNGRFHSDWCSMIYSRLMLARNLLTDDGVIFISIDDSEVKNLKNICDEVFGAACFIAQIAWKRKKEISNDSRNVSIQGEYVLCYGKPEAKLHLEPLSDEYVSNSYNEPTEEFTLGKWRPVPLTVSKGLSGGGYTYTITTPSGKHHTRLWAYPEVSYKKLLSDGKVYFGKNGDGVPQRVMYLSESKGQPTTNYWDNVATNKEGKKDILSIFGNNAFDTPKPTKLIKKMMCIAANEDSIILDFFSGSATTAHAVMQLNAEDGGHRKFIMVQLPEKCDEASEAYKAGYKNICEIGKERIRRAGEKIKESLREYGYSLRKLKEEGTPYKIASRRENDTSDDPDYISNPEIITGSSVIYDEPSNRTAIQAEMAEALDVGFRVLKLDDTNMKDVYYAPDDYDQGMLAGLESNIKDDRTDLDLLFGCLIDWGLPLSLPYKSEKIDGCTVHTYNDGDLIACFDANIPESVVKEIAKRRPLRAVFRDSGFASSPEKINVFEIFKLYMPEDTNDITKRVRVI